MKIAPVILALLLLAFPAKAENRLALMTEEFAPYQFYEEGNDEITGISIEIVKAIQARIGNTSEIKVLPWSRALKIVGLQKNTALFSTARTPDREERFKWVGPISDLEMVFFRRKDSGIEFDSLEAARKLAKIGVTKNVATHEILTDMGFTNLDVMKSGSDDKNLKRLIKGRIDVWPTVFYAGVYSARKMGILDKIERVPDVSIMSGYLYIALNKDTDPDIIHAWQIALDGLKSEGVIDSIIAKYDQ